MLRKKDLVKEFELVVKQEIVEHNKAISASTLALNGVREKVLELSKNLESQGNKLETKILNLTYDFEFILNSHKFIKNNFSKLVSDNEKLNDRNFKEITLIDKGVETVHRNQQNLKAFFDSFVAQFDDVNKYWELYKKSNENELSRLKCFFLKKLQKQKEEILSMPSKSEAVKREFMEELSMHKLDNEGLLKEIKVLKKTVFINEKKIEHLNTLIERMNIKR